MKSIKPVYPPLPDKRYFTIGEAAALALSKPHILRYWEREIPRLARVSRRNGGRRYYTVDDVLLLRRIRSLLYDEGYTINGVSVILANANSRGKSDEKLVTGSRDNILFVRREIEKIIKML